MLYLLYMHDAAKAMFNLEVHELERKTYFLKRAAY